MSAPVTRLVFLVASHLHMTAGAIRKSMSAHELFCWACWLGETQHEAPQTAQAKRGPEPAPMVLAVDDEIAAWPSR
jgi:hypothetical protein